MTARLVAQAEREQAVVDVVAVGLVDPGSRCRSRAAKIVRLSIETSVSATGTPTSSTGISVANPADSSVELVSVKQPSRYPIAVAPESPRNTLAGWRLYGRKPRMLPAEHERRRPPVPGSCAEQHRGQARRRDQAQAGRQAVEPVDEVEGVGDADEPERPRAERPSIRA